MPAAARSFVRTTAGSSARTHVHAFVATVLTVLALSTAAGTRAQSTGTDDGIAATAVSFVHAALPCVMC